MGKNGGGGGKMLGAANMGRGGRGGGAKRKRIHKKGQEGYRGVEDQRRKRMRNRRING